MTTEPVILAENLGTYEGFPVRYMTLETLLAQGEAGTLAYYVWPHEGQPKSGRFVFHKGMIKDSKGHESEAPEKPMLVDAGSARGFMLIYNAANDTNKGKSKKFIEEHRGLFYYFMTKIVWPNVSFGGR